MDELIFLKENNSYTEVYLVAMLNRFKEIKLNGKPALQFDAFPLIGDNKIIAAEDSSRSTHKFIGDTPLSRELMSLLSIEAPLLAETEEFSLYDYNEWLLFENEDSYWCKFTFLKKKEFDNYIEMRQQEILVAMTELNKN